jgi:hypothetical protein
MDTNYGNHLKNGYHINGERHGRQSTADGRALMPSINPSVRHGPLFVFAEMGSA